MSCLNKSPRLLLPLFLLGLVTGCSTPGERKIFPQGALIEQILVPRAGYPGALTSGSCEMFSKDNTCLKFTILSYDLRDQATRDELRDLDFICKIGEKRFTICKDKEGFCHLSYNRKKFLWFTIEKTEVHDFVGAEETTRLINAGTVCFNEDRYPYLEM